ncbi:MAG TPA: cell division protein ZapA [Geminicoccaceae bacterium]|nr:cell division protein ZapA [Geminicoccaceae bacterium]
MATVDVVVNGRRHQLQCDDGQETRLKRLAAYVDKRVSDLAQNHGQIGDTRLLLMTSLLVADELSDAYDELKRLRTALTDTAKQTEKQASTVVEEVAQRLEAIASRLEGA